MPTKDGLTNNHPLPLFLAEHAEAPEQWDIGKAWDKAAISSRILKSSILVVTATAIGVAVISMGNPVVLLANVKVSLFDAPALQPGTGQSTPTIQSTAGTQDLLPIARDEPSISPGDNPESAPPLDGKTAVPDTPTNNEIAAAFEPADQSQAEAGQPSADDLFKQFQAWAAEQDNGHRSDPHKMPQHRLCKMPRNGSDPCKCTDTSVTCRMCGRRSGRCKVPEKRSGGSKMHEYRSRPSKTPEHRVKCKIPRHRRSCKASVYAIRPRRK
jgi:hypothetical protein